MAAQADASGFFSGFMHPVLGFDHLLAMVAVGLLSVQIGGRAIWVVPGAFVGFLAVGGVLGLYGIDLPQVEGAIAISVLALGVVIAARTSLPAVAAMAIVGFFAIFHGHAHGMEIPRLAEPWQYVLGFMLASAALHLSGVLIGWIGGREILRAQLGAGIAGIGLHMALLTYALI